jgi:hypothetical protein
MLAYLSTYYLTKSNIWYLQWIVDLCDCHDDEQFVMAVHSGPMEQLMFELSM